MKRLHIVGGKNHGKTTLIVELVQELAGRGIAVGTIKHTHHQHELDVPGKDSHRHRVAGANVVGILTPTMTAVFRPVSGDLLAFQDRYDDLDQMFASCQFVIVEGNSQTSAPKIEVWRAGLGTAPLAARDSSVLAVVTDDACSTTAPILRRTCIHSLTNWVVQRFQSPPTMLAAVRSRVC